MGGVLCKIFRFILNVFTQVVTVVAEAIKVLGNAAVDVLSDLFQAAGDALSGLLGGNGILSLLLVGGLVWFFVGRDDDEDDKKGKQTTGGNLDNLIKDGI